MGTVGGDSVSHTIFEAWANGAWHLLDTDQMVFFLKRDNRTVASVADLARDPKLMSRSHRNLGLAGKDLAEKDYYSAQFENREFVYPTNPSGAWTRGRWSCATGCDAVAAAPYDGDALAAGREVGALLGSGGQDGGAGASAAPGGAVFQRQAGLSARFAKSAGAEGIRTAGECGAGNVGAIAGCSSDSGTARFPNDLEGVFTISNCRSEGGFVPTDGRAGKTGLRCCCLWMERTGGRFGWRWDIGQVHVWIWTGILNPALFDWRGDWDPGWRVGPRYEYYVQVAMWAGANAGDVGMDKIWFDTDLQCATAIFALAVLWRESRSISR